ncbi:hypothetical protein FA95DRAFT_425581 [Auriscalpium vulgare]|uniref:Uncharacterized protein n=1 Tax=Auriscalpium vulgare TaxID=40419 RepID=A0ACB8S579_9AGAM|nr:hypothetical protein FA95DRAFT_425581 [Auriscalpium vulgare]
MHNGQTASGVTSCRRTVLEALTFRSILPNCPPPLSPTAPPRPLPAYTHHVRTCHDQCPQAVGDQRTDPAAALGARAGTAPCADAAHAVRPVAALRLPVPVADAVAHRARALRLRPPVPLRPRPPRAPLPRLLLLLLHHLLPVRVRVQRVARRTRRTGHPGAEPHARGRCVRTRRARPACARPPSHA